MPSVPEDLDVYKLPHGQMKQLVQDIEQELLHTDFGDSVALRTLLAHLDAHLHQFQCHEEIENQYIVRRLMPRLPTGTKTTLENDIHSDSRLGDLMSLVRDGLQLECSSSSSEPERLAFGRRLKGAIDDFTVDFIPHMNEEEEVFLPLLLEYFSEGELRQLREMVLELHHIPAPHSMQQGISPVCGSDQMEQSFLFCLPPELLLKIFSYLSPVDLCRLAPLHSALYTLTFDPTLWQHLHPVRWARGNFDFFPPFYLGKNAEDGLSQDAVVENDIAKELLSAGASVNANLLHLASGLEEKAAEAELRVLCGVLESVLPKVGPQVVTLDLAHGKAVTNEVVFRMLRQCPNLTSLDLSHTKISDFAFRGLLGKGSQMWGLQYIDLTGCSLISDTALQRLGQALSPAIPGGNSQTMAGGGNSQTMAGGGNSQTIAGGGGRGREGCLDSQLKCLILSGCSLITDAGLRALVKAGGFPSLCYLDLSGLCNITRAGLSELVAASPLLKPELFFYCDNLLHGPYSTCANGCLNVGSESRLCCRRLV